MYVRYVSLEHECNHSEVTLGQPVSMTPVENSFVSTFFYNCSIIMGPTPHTPSPNVGA